MIDRIEELAKMAYEARHPYAAQETWDDCYPTYKAWWLHIARTLYAAIMTEAAGAAKTFDLSIMSSTEADIMAAKIATALLAKSKGVSDAR